MVKAANHKAVFLFGAGAVLDWGAPLTLCSGVGYTKIPEHDTGEIYNRPCCLTHLMLVTGFKAKTGERITQRIFNRLKEEDPNAYVNFETILNVIEDLYAYWSARSSKDKTNIYGLIDIDELLANLHDFTVLSQPGSNSYALEVPDFILRDADNISTGIDPHVKYYELLLKELLSGIIGHVSKYGYASPTHKVYEKEVNAIININFRQWIRSFIAEGKILRLYTLNYDDIFKQMLEQEGEKVFDGFYEYTAPGQYYAAADLTRIVTDNVVNCHYNLHGSEFWKVEDLNASHLPGYQYLKSLPGVIHSSAASLALEKGKRLLLTNIISGYQKVQKTAISPFRQFFSALDRDCLEAEELYLIGYSYGDEHVNDIIRNARRYNPEMRITLINPGFDDYRFAVDFLSNWGQPGPELYEKMADNAVLSKRFKVLALTDKFSDFLAAFAAGTGGSYW
ncbi:MAG TPA: SIR2 family protein [Mucilaginibacter sp.]|jgi:hypothetical protein